jgi:hypothetical protein
MLPPTAVVAVGICFEQKGRFMKHRDSSSSLNRAPNAEDEVREDWLQLLRLVARGIARRLKFEETANDAKGAERAPHVENDGLR